MLGVFRRLVLRLFFLPLYALLAIPYVVLIFGSEEAFNKSVIFKIAAFFAGKPDATSLTDVQQAQAVLTVFVLFDLLAEIFSYFRHSPEETTNKQKHMRRRMYAQWVLTLIGWTILGVSLYQEKGHILGIGLLGIGIIVCALFWMEYSLREIFDRIISASNKKS